MERIAIILTVFNRKEKTAACLDAVYAGCGEYFEFDVFLTDDGSTDGTSEYIKTRFPHSNLHILEGNGSLFWNGGMNNSWKAAIAHGSFDGYLWLNNDTTPYNNLWEELKATDEYAKREYEMGGIYVGSTNGEDKKCLTYGGFNYTNRFTLTDSFCVPNGDFQTCQCAHGNILYVSANVVEKMGVLCEGYIHGGGDHDYTYLAYKAGFPLVVMREFVGFCINDHKEDGYYEFVRMKLKDRLRYMKSPLGFNLHNTLLFQKRCFPYRYPFVWTVGYLKALFPRSYFFMYKTLRSIFK